MTGIDDFKAGIEDMIRRSDEEASHRKALHEEKAGKRNEMLLHFDRYADEIQEQVIAPRVTYLASKFSNSMKPLMREEFEYRHRIQLHFAHTEEFPCIADITFLIVHCDVREFLSVKFEHVILPAYVTPNYKFSDSIQVKMDSSSYPAVAQFAESCIETFLSGYLRTKAI